MTKIAQAKTVVDLLRARGQSVSVAESLTAGGLGHAITEVPGASEVFLGGIVAYSPEVKIAMLAVPPEVIAKYSIVSEEVANSMADGALKKFGSTWALATTGIAGPDDYQGIKAGTVWVAIRGPINQTLQLHIENDREAVRQGAISSAIGTFSRILSAIKQ